MPLAVEDSKSHWQTLIYSEMQLILSTMSTQVESLNITLYQSMASEAALASMNLTSACIRIEKSSEKLQADLAVKDIFVYALKGLQREFLLSRWSGESILVLAVCRGDVPVSL